jgi:hypothetical protein
METPAQIELVNRDHLPEELARFEGLRLEGTQLKGVEGTGETPQLRGLGSILMKTLVELGAARVVSSSDPDPGIGQAIRLFETLNQHLQGQVENLRAERDELNQRLDRLDQRLKRYEEGVSGFMVGDEVGRLRGDDEVYELGYIVVGYTDDDKVKIRDPETDEVHDVESGELLHSTDVEFKDEDLLGFEEGEEVTLQLDDAADTYEYGYRVVGLGSEPGTLEIIDVETWERQDVDPDKLAHKHELEESEFSEGDEVGLPFTGNKFRKGILVREDEDEEWMWVRPDGIETAIRIRKSAVRPWDEVPTEQRIEIKKSETPDLPPKGRLRRVSGSLGGFLLGRQVQLHNGMYNLVDRRGRDVVAIDPEVAAVYEESNERTGAVALGAVALAGLAGVVGYLIGHKTGHTTIVNHNHTVIVPGSGARPEAGSALSIPGPNSSGRHVDLFNAAPGHRKTAVDLPKTVHFKKLFGHGILVDDKGRTIVGRLKHGLFDEQGNLSLRARTMAKAKGYLLTQGQLGKRYMTYIWQR